jgi:hypothetical protein
MSRHSGAAAEADNHSDISPFRINTLRAVDRDVSELCTLSAIMFSFSGLQRQSEVRVTKLGQANESPPIAYRQKVNRPIAHVCDLWRVEQPSASGRHESRGDSRRSVALTGVQAPSDIPPFVPLTPFAMTRNRLVGG